MDYVGAATDVTGVNNPKEALNFNVFEGSRFGEVAPIDLDVAEPKWVTVDATVLPVNQIYVDGVRIAGYDVHRDEYKVALKMQRGRHHIEYRFEPGVTWSILRTVTEVLFFGLMLVCFYGEARVLSKDAISRI
jgi:hypothetical protein